MFVLLVGCARGVALDSDPDAAVDPTLDAALDAASDAAGDAAAPPGCAADAECASGACNEATGACVDESRVLFVAPGGTDGACTRSAPCLTIAHAASLLAANRDVIALAAGAYAGTFTLAKPALLSGPTRDPTAVMLTSPSHDAIIATLDATISVEGVTIGGNTVTNGAQAVTIGSGAHATFDRVTTRDNAFVAVFVEGATLVATRYTSSASNYGILADYTSTLDVDRSRFVDDANGIAAANSYRVVNSVFVHDGVAFSVFGSSNTGTLAFDTFVMATSTVVSAPHPITANSSIFANCPVAPSPMVAVSYSLFTGAPPAGTGNLMGDPAFVDADYHIGATSAAIDRADPAATEAHDLDGGPRPTGVARDIGADER